MTIGFGIIGTGRMGNVHAAAIAATAGAKLIGVADVDAERAQSLAKEHNLSHCFADYHDLLEIPEVTAVVVATPDAEHRQPAVVADRAGRHVFQAL